MNKIYESGLLEFFGYYNENMYNYLKEDCNQNDFVVMDMSDNKEITVLEFITQATFIVE